MQACPSIKTGQNRAMPIAGGGAQEFSYLLERERLPGRFLLVLKPLNRFRRIMDDQTLPARLIKRAAQYPKEIVQRTSTFARCPFAISGTANVRGQKRTKIDPGARAQRRHKTLGY